MAANVDAVSVPVAQLVELANAVDALWVATRQTTGSAAAHHLSAQAGLVEMRCLELVQHARALRDQSTTPPHDPACHNGVGPTPSRGVPAAASCPVCRAPFVPGTNQRYCSKACRDTAWRRRHQNPSAATVVPPGRSQRELTVYECDGCGSRTLGEQRCADCMTFMHRVGTGGLCPHCDEAVAVEDLLDRKGG